MKRLHPNKSEQNRGFTIVELLIVVIVIAILAAVSIVAYNGIQRRAGSIAYTAAARDLEQYIRIADITGTYQREPDTVESSGEALGYVLAFILLSVIGAPSPGGHCVGRVADYPATNDFAAGECYKITDETSGESQSFSINEPLSTKLEEAGMPLPRNLPTVRRTISLGESRVSIVARGIYVLLLEKYTYVMWNPPDSSSCGTGQNLGHQFLEALQEVDIEAAIAQAKEDPAAVAEMEARYGSDWETTYRELLYDLTGPNRTGACVSMFEHK